MPTARVDTGDRTVTGEYEDGVVTAGEESYVVGEDATLLAPVDPPTTYCVGRNYRTYVEQDLLSDSEFLEAEIPDALHFFLKSAPCVVGPDATVPYPTFTDEVGYAGELAAVVGDTCRHATPEEAADAVRGYTILNDLDAKDQAGVTEMKVFDGSAPIGPVVADVDPSDLSMRTTVGGEVRQEATTAEMVRKPPQVLSELSERVTLHPDDVVAMGSPANPGLVDPGETVEIRYEGIGTLRTHLGERD